MDAQQFNCLGELDGIFELLSDRWCRFVLYRLHGTTDVVEVEEVVEYVDELNGIDGSGNRSIDRTLREVHLPRLDEAGLIDYDTRSGSIRYWGRPAFTEWLEHARHKELNR